jgi:hypothetical protein
MSSQVDTAYSFLLSKGYSPDRAWAEANAIHSTAGTTHARTRSSTFDMSGLGDSLPSARSNTHVPARRSKLDDFGISSTSGFRAAPSHRYVDEDRYGTGSGYDEYKVREVRPGYSHHSSRVETRDGGYREYSSTTSFSFGASPAANNDYADDGYGQGKYKVREERPKTRGYSASTSGRGDAYDEEDDYPRGGAPKSARPSTRHTRRTYDKSYPTTGAGYRDGDWSDGETRGGAKSSGKYRTREAHPKDYSSARTKYPTRDAHTEEKSGYSSYRTRDAYPEGKPSSSSKSHYESSNSRRPKYNRDEPPHFSPPENEPVNVGVKPPVDLYVVLGMSRSASADELKATHRKLSLKHHPDRVQGGEAAKKAATDKMVEINRAYDVLKDEKQRGIYDRTGRVHETS